MSLGMGDCSSPGCLEHLPQAAEATLGPPCSSPRSLADGRCGPTGGACCNEAVSRLPHSLREPTPGSSPCSITLGGGGDAGSQTCPLWGAEEKGQARVSTRASRAAVRPQQGPGGHEV